MRPNEQSEKNQRHVPFQDKKLQLVISFLKPEFRFTRKIKKLKKVAKFRFFYFFLLSSEISTGPFVRFCYFFTDHWLFFQIKKSFKKFKILRKIFEKVIIDPEKRLSGSTAKFWRDGKNGCRVRNERPKINKIVYFWLLTSVTGWQKKTCQLAIFQRNNSAKFTKICI